MWDVVLWGSVALATSLGQLLTPLSSVSMSGLLTPCSTTHPMCTLLSCMPRIPPTVWSCSPLGALEAQREADVVTRLTSERMGSETMREQALTAKRYLFHIPPKPFWYTGKCLKIYLKFYKATIPKEPSVLGTYQKAGV